MRLAIPLYLALASLSFTACARLDDTPIKPDPAPTAPPPEDAVLLGQPCPDPSVQRDPTGPYVGCGRDGKIGLVSWNGRRPLPADARRLEGSMGNVLVAVEANRVWVQSTCPMCRTFLETTIVVDLAHATDEQLAQAETSAELQNKSLLRDAAAWRAALEDWEPRR